MTLNQFLIMMISWWPWVYVKLMIIILLLLYLIYAGILLRQITLMNQMVEAQISPFLRLVAIIHLVATAAILFLVFMVL